MKRNVIIKCDTTPTIALASLMSSFKEAPWTATSQPWLQNTLNLKINLFAPKRMNLKQPSEDFLPKRSWVAAQAKERFAF